MNVLIDRWLNDDRVDRTYIPCELCGDPTNFLGTKMCNCCYEVTSRLMGFLNNQNAIDLVMIELEDA